MALSFWLKLALSFLVGGAWVAMSTLMAERHGSRIGGLIGGFPSTIVVILLFIGWTQTPQAAVQATLPVPVAMGLNGVFLLVFLLLAKRGLLLSLAAALLVWFLQASLLVAMGPNLFILSIAAWILLSGACVLATAWWMRVPHQGGRKVPYSHTQTGYRALFSGTVIASAVLIGKLGGPVTGGVFATFPAVFTSTIVVTYRSGGPDFARAVVKSLLLSGLINVPVYAIAVRYTYPSLGMAWGTAAALLVSLGSAYVSYRMMMIQKSLQAN